MNFQPIPEETLDEIVAGAGGVVENKADTAVSFLDEMSTWLSEVITIIKTFFDRLMEAMNSAE